MEPRSHSVDDVTEKEATRPADGAGRVDPQLLSSIIARLRPAPPEPRKVAVYCYQWASGVFEDLWRYNGIASNPVGLCYLGPQIAQVRRMEGQLREEVIREFELFSEAVTNAVLRGSAVSKEIGRPFHMEGREACLMHNLMVRFFSEDARADAETPVLFGDKLLEEVRRISPQPGTDPVKPV